MHTRRSNESRKSRHRASPKFAPKTTLRSERAVRFAVKRRDCIRRGMNVADSSRNLVGAQHIVASLRVPVFFTGNRIGRDLPDIAGRMKIVKRRGSGFFV